MNITTEHLTIRYGDTTAVDDLSLDLPGGRIIALLGRNGAGKSTLLRAVAGYCRPTSGRVLVDGAAPFDDAARTAQTVLARGRIPQADNTNVRDHLELAALFRPGWDQAFADRLLDRFEVPRTRTIGKLSTGQRGAVDVTTALASRARLTILDEPYLGMDVPSRYALYDELLADYAEHPRTFILATHVIDEITRLIEDVVILDRGRLLLHESIDELEQRGAELTGPTDAVERLAAGHTVLSRRTLGGSSAVVVDAPAAALRVDATTLGVDVGSIPLQDLFVHLTTPTETTPKDDR